MDIYSVNPKSGISKLLLRETDKAWIEESILDNISFYPDFFVIASSRSGYQHLFRYNYNGTLAKQITKGEWNVSAFLGYDEKVALIFTNRIKKVLFTKPFYKINEKKG